MLDFARTWQAADKIVYSKSLETVSTPKTRLEREFDPQAIRDLNLSAAYVGMLAGYGARSSVGRPGTCFDNAAAESFFATLKTELIHRAIWPTRQHARTAIFHYVEGFYNRLRRHSTLAYQSPADFEADHRSTTLAA